jgi:hypothetical protein
MKFEVSRGNLSIWEHGWGEGVPESLIEAHSAGSLSLDVPVLTYSIIGD